MGKNKKIYPSDVKKLAEECKNLAESLSFNNPIIGNKKTRNGIKIKPINENLRNRNLFEYSIPSDDERDNLRESAKESDIYKRIVYDLESELNKVDEINVLEEGVLDVIRKYASKKLLTVAIIAQLLSTGKVTAQQLNDAGVEPEKVEVAMDQNKGGSDSSKPGKPTVFNYANVKAIAVVDNVGEEQFKIWRNFDFTTYGSSTAYKFVNVPYKLTTDENLAKASVAWNITSSIDYRNFKSNSDTSTTYNAIRDFYIIGTNDTDSITYTVSDYPMDVTTKSGDTIKFLGVQVWEGKTRNHTNFINTDKGVAAAKLPKKGTYFLPGEGRNSMTVKGNSVSINLVYGKGLNTSTEDTTASPGPLSMKSGELFKYNSKDVNTSSSDYQKMLGSTIKLIKANPDHKFTLDVFGSSSQVPTNYPTLSGEKTIGANKQLASDRARSLGVQILKDLKEKGVDISNIKKGKLKSVIGDTEYQNDPTNISRYAPDQYAEFTLTPLK